MEHTVIGVRDLEVECIIGVWPHERTKIQSLLIDVEVSVDVVHAARDDDYSQTVDYQAIADGIRFILTIGRFQLLETACSAVLQWLLNRRDRAIGPTIQRAKIQIRKPSALPGRATAFVEAENTVHGLDTTSGDYISRAGALRLKQAIIAVGDTWTPPESVNRCLFQGEGLTDQAGSMVRGEWERPNDCVTVYGFENHGERPISVLFPDL